MPLIRVVAIGETGLDYFRSAGDLEWQRGGQESSGRRNRPGSR
jgi:Tat protein secretion system quality control protein TatD with DNase activity